jgi:hypothetical protein
VRQNHDSSEKSTFCQSCLVQQLWVCAHRRSCCRWCLVRTCLTTGLRALSPASLSLLRTVWGLMAELCVHGVSRAVVVATLYLSRRCDVRMYRSCWYTWSAAARMISCPSCLPVALSSVSHSTDNTIYCPGTTSAVLIPPCSMPKAHSHRWAGTLGIFLLVFFRVSRKTSFLLS